MVLSRKGKIICAVPPDHPAASNGYPVFDWADALIDSLIVGSLTFFSTLAGTGIVNGVHLNDIVSSVVAGAISFLTFLSIKRGISGGKSSG